MKSLIIMLIFSIQIFGTTYFVKTTGNDSNDGLTGSTAFLTLQKVYNTVAAGDEVYVYNGSYDMGTGGDTLKTSGTAVAWIEFIAVPDGDNEVFITQQYLNNGLIANSINYVKFIGFHWWNAARVGTGTLDFVDCSNIIFRRNFMHAETNVTNSAGFLRIDNSSSIVVYGNVFNYGNSGESRGIDILNSSSSVDLQYNVFMNATGSSCEVVNLSADVNGGHVFKNNIIAFWTGSNTLVNLESADNMSITNNDFYSVASSTKFGGAGYSSGDEGVVFTDSPSWKNFSALNPNWYSADGGVESDVDLLYNSAMISISTELQDLGHKQRVGIEVGQ